MEILMTLFLFNIFKGEEKLSEREIHESIFVKLKPVAIAIYTIVTMIVMGTIFVYSLYTQTQDNKLTKLSASEYRVDRKLDSIMTVEYRKTIDRSFDEIIQRLDEIQEKKQSKKKNSD